MKRNITALILLNVGVFVIAAAFLPKPPGGYTYSYDGPISQFFGYLSHSRMHWHIPFLVTLGTALISGGALISFSKRRDHSHDNAA